MREKELEAGAVPRKAPSHGTQCRAVFLSPGWRRWLCLSPQTAVRAQRLVPEQGALVLAAVSPSRTRAEAARSSAPAGAERDGMLGEGTVLPAVLLMGVGGFHPGSDQSPSELQPRPFCMFLPMFTLAQQTVGVNETATQT